MSGSLFVRDLGAYSVQLALLVGAAALLARILPLRPPLVALRYWQALLLACLVLPLGQPRQAPEPKGMQARAQLAPAATTPAEQPAAAWVRPAWASAETVLAILGAGVAARVAWLGVGLFSLGGLRRRAKPLPADMPELLRAQQRLGVCAEFFSSDETEVPITFGLVRPAVLLPPAVLAMEAQAQQAILCHELLHVRRRDWLYAVAEECVRALLWFHPAVAWLVGRIQLSREQAVDRAVIAITESREEYVGALLAVARAKARPQLLLAPLFLRKNRLKQRVAEILEEGTMSKQRLISHLLTSGFAVLLAAGVGVRLFPLPARAAGSESTPVQIVRGGEGLLHRERVEYPRRAVLKRVAGDVLLEVSLDETGQVQDARVLSGPDELRAAALRSVLRWHYAAPASLPSTHQVQLGFTLPEGEVEPEQPRHERHAAAGDVARQAQLQELDHARNLHERELDASQSALGQMRKKFVYEEQLAAGHAKEAELRSKRDLEHQAQMLGKLKQLERDSLPASEAELLKLREKFEYQEELGAAQAREEELRWKRELEAKEVLEKLHAAKAEGRLSAIHAAGLAPDVLKALLPQLGVSVGDAIDAATLERVRAAVARFDEHVRVELGRSPDGGVILLLVAP